MGDRLKKRRRFRGNLWVRFQYILHYRETLGRNSARADLDIINTNPKIVFAVSIDRYCTETIALSAKHARVTDCLSRCRPIVSLAMI
ncbi:hypothetical protein BofuT4_uP044240.1 [Botrytis cinerea T4]|uniref:Uncharacterized protein n=1 Tax=Botryotinia fuckeliana (strain T4) TaxID=999810 RepID=G2XY69_BOTF4|nr:hypothetical protein BofuT4_uP044240.1 [Botrytis cinerea T4]